MSRHVLVGSVAALALGVVASTAGAQCTFEHPRVSPPRNSAQRSSTLSSGLVQAFVSCGNLGGNAPNATTEGGVPTCAPPETFHEQDGSPAGGWMWDEGRSNGLVTIYPSRNRVDHILNPPANTVDLTVTLRLRSIIDENGPADGTGTLALVVRTTLADRANGPMTIVDFPANFPVVLDNGRASLKTTVNGLLNDIGQPGLPGCTSIEVVSVLVLDENGNPFANMGSFLPPT